MIKIKALFAAFICSVSAMAQDIQLVTLQHGENMTAYYGMDAFKDAMEASAAGDMITLSGGTFNATTINKAVTIQGAGYVEDIANNRYLTRISGDLNIDLPEGASGLVIEGIWNNHNVKVVSSISDFILKRCRIDRFFFEGQSKNCLILQCRFCDFHPDAHAQNLLVLNSTFNWIFGNESDATLCYENCVIVTNGGSYSINEEKYPPIATFKNCVIQYPSKNPGCIAYNNVTHAEKFTTKSNQNEYHIIYWSDVYDGSVNWESPLTLKEDAATKYLGTDGTQVGIYGGTNGFTDVPSNPQVTLKTIAPQSDTNGKLSVKITVEAQKN